MIQTLGKPFIARPMPGHRRTIEPLIANRRPPVAKPENSK